MPEPVIIEEGAWNIGLDDLPKKRSKREKHGNDAIDMLDSPEDIRLKV